MAEVLHDDEIPIDAGLVRALVDRATPHYRALSDFGYDLDAAERLWDEAMRLPGAKDRPAHGGTTAT